MSEKHDSQVLQLLKELTSNNSDIKENVGTLLDRMTKLETVVMGINNHEGMYGSLKKIEKLIENIKPLTEKINLDINNPNTGINDQIKEIKDEIKEDKNAIIDLKSFKLKVITVFTVAQTALACFIYIVNKFNLFGRN
jgi:hypothetical protein